MFCIAAVPFGMGSTRHFCIFAIKCLCFINFTNKIWTNLAVSTTIRKFQRRVLTLIVGPFEAQIFHLRKRIVENFAQ